MVEYHQSLLDNNLVLNPLKFRSVWFSVLTEAVVNKLKLDAWSDQKDLTATTDDDDAASNLNFDFSICKIAETKCSAEFLRDSANSIFSSTLINRPTSNKRPILILDLDNTLVHAQSKARLGNLEITLSDFFNPSGDPELYRFSLLKGMDYIYYAKLRPGVFQFLEALKPYYTFAIHTNASAEYADIIIGVLDPTRKLFGLRVVARESGLTLDARKDLRRLVDPVEVSDRLLILDDRQDVWDPAYGNALFRCHCYEYFESRREVLASKYAINKDCPGNVPYIDTPNYVTYTETDLTCNNSNFDNVTSDDNNNNNDGDDEGSLNTTRYSEISNKNAPKLQNEDASDCDNVNARLVDNDRQLFHIANLFRKLAIEYEHYYKNYASVPISTLLQKSRSHILKNCIVLLNGFHKATAQCSYGSVDDYATHSSLLISMGASIVEAPNENVTHIVVLRPTPNFDHIVSHCSSSVAVVHSFWIYACNQTWTQVDESLFNSAELLQNHSKPSMYPGYAHWQYTKQLTTDEFTKINLDNNLLHNNNNKTTIQHKTVETSIPSKNKVELIESVWPCTNEFSAGSQIWSANEHKTLLYDPYIIKHIRDNTPDII